jgi:signal transduction histidine kinase
VGTLVADDIIIKRADSGEILFEDAMEHGDRLHTSQGMPLGWKKYGSSRNVLQIVSFPDAHRTNHALAVFDDKIGFSGVWSMSVPLAGRVRRGDVLIMEWREMFSSGWGGRATVGYEYVPPGRYVFRLRAITPLDERAQSEVTLTVMNPTPLWQTGWFLLLSAVVGAATIAWSVRAIVRFRWKRRVERLEWQQAIERERARIARDMHDDVGAHLTRIGLLSQMIHNEMPAGSAVSDAAESMDIAVRATTQAMSELVWAVNPRYDTLDGLANYFGRYAQEWLSMAGVRCRLDLPPELPEMPLAASARHQLFLAFKEALNNSVRHAGARDVCVALTMSAEQLVLTLTDDGCGFDTERVTTGHGLRNMTTRLRDLGGFCEIISRPGGGTIVRLGMPVRGPVCPPAGAVAKDGDP